MKTFLLKRLMICAVLLPAAVVTASPLTVLHSFSGAANDGANPHGSPALSGDVLFGATTYGGSTNFGTLFKMNTDGTGYTNLYSFRGTSADGSIPWGAPLSAGNMLYGLTSLGGPLTTNGFTLSTNSVTGAVTTNWFKSINGTVFKLDDEGIFTILHNFTGTDINAGFDDGSDPQGGLILNGDVLYGCTRQGGVSNAGTVFSVSIGGDAYAVLHSFTGGAENGAMPVGSLTLLDGALYGLTPFGGSNNYGTVFRINTDGTGFTVLYSFRGAPWDGSHPQGSLLFSGGMLYGLTPFGGTGGFGTLFRIGTDGTGYTTVCNFTGTVTDGAHPYGSLIADGGMLYGMTAYGGSSHAGTLFRISADGSGFQVFHSFSGGEDDGAYPYGTPQLSDGKLYGMTSQGGASGEGVVFSLTVPDADSDADGLPDWWEEQYFGGATNAQSSASAANGINTIYEAYIAGLDPTDPDAIFSVSGLSPLSSQSTLQWQSVSGRVYSIYWTTNLLNGFEPAAVNIVWPQSNWTDEVNGGGSPGFYLLKVFLE